MDALSVAGLKLRLDESPFGPTVAESDEAFLPLTLVVNGALIGKFPGLVEAAERREEIGAYPLFARPVAPDEELSEAVEEWQRLTGGDLGDDAFALSTAFGAREFFIPRAALLELLARLREMRAAKEKPPGPWLFSSRPPIWHEPAPDEHAALQILEEQAAALEETVAAPRTPEAAATEAARRRFLLVELEAHGLLEEAGSFDKLRWLNAWGLDLLRGYFEATLAVHAYFRSEERRRHIPGATDGPLLGGHVSLDWFRRPIPPPEGVEPNDWLGFCERTLLDNLPVTGQEGEILTRIGGPWYRTFWRRDDGETPAVVRAEVLG